MLYIRLRVALYRFRRWYVIIILGRGIPYDSGKQDPAAELAEHYCGTRGNQTAMLVKCLDRCNNLSSMAASFTAERMARYITETEDNILPLLEEIKRRYLQWNDAAFLLKYQMLPLLETQKALLMGR